MGCNTRLASVVAVGLVLAAGGAAQAGTPRSVAVFPFQIADTSGEPPDPARPSRLAAATAELAAVLASTGQYKAVDLAPFAPKIAVLQSPDECGTCWAQVAKDAGAQLEVLPSVHKVSTLITLMTIWVADVTTMKYVARVEGQIRGDTPEAYQRGIQFLVTQELTKKLPP
jgi:hypothetical protein